MGVWQLGLLSLLLLTVCDAAPLQFVSEFTSLNNRPIIGVAAQETKKGHPLGDTYISATYVKFLQQAGARVVPVRAGEPLEYYHDLFSKLNGVLFPGGTVSLTKSLYSRTGGILYNLTMQAYDASKEVFPIWGTCLGFELLNTITAGQNLLQKTDAENLILPLNFSYGFRHSRMFGGVPEDVLTYLKTEPVTQNQHMYGMLTDVFKDNSKLRNFYHVLSTNVGRNGVEFVSTFEAFKYPIYGTQWHPEKNAFKWDPHYVINHSEHAVRVGQSFANFFVGEARKSTHRFPSAKAERAAMINNISPVFAASATFSEIYFLNFTESAIQNMNMMGIM